MNDKPSQASLTRFCLESGADTRERNLFLRQRFSLARRHIDRTIALRLAYSANGKSGFANSLRRAVGAPAEETGGENFIFTPSNPRQTAVSQQFGFSADADNLQKLAIRICSISN
ncbi:MAG: hypothetical protein IKX31_08595 [Muribaculaceae bacterium]|nr:hypothetical protein [Muribaculaceae bacterium]